MGLVGDWKSIFDWFRRRDRDLKETAREMLTEIGQSSQAIIKRRIESGQVGGPELAKVTKTQKRQKGLDARKLIATGAYLRSIKYKMDGDLAVDIQPDRKYYKLAMWLEFGTSQTPARPHWRPAFSEMKSEARRIGKRYGFEMK